MPLSTTLEALHEAIQMTMGAILDPAHEEHRGMLDWYGWPFDPIGFDEARAHFGMENMVRRRRGPLASHRSGSRRAKR